MWGPEQQLAFETMVTAFTTAPALRHFDHGREVINETDGSDYVSAGVWSQRDDEGILHPVAYYSKKHSLAECNYDIYDKELMAIIKALEEWRRECEGAAYPLQLITDHKNLEYFMTKKLSNRRQARWSEFLTGFDYNFVYRPGMSNGKADALTRRPGDLPEEGDERLKNMEQVVLKPHNLPEQLRILASDTLEGQVPSISDLFTQAYKDDPLPNKILEAIRQGGSLSDITIAECMEQEGRVWYRGKCYVPEGDQLRLRLIQEHHDTALAGHPGRAKTFDLLDRKYYWKNMRKQVDQYVRNCQSCQRSKSSRHTTFGVLRPLTVPEWPWEDISMDFVVGLPECEGFDAVWVVVDRLSKMRHSIPCHTTIDAIGLAKIFLREVVRLHGLPRTIISDRGPRFASTFWGQICSRLGIDRRMSTAFHAQTDGQTERMNAGMEQYLRAFVNHQQDDGVQWLPLAEFAADNGVSESTKCSPFFAVPGVDPRMSFAGEPTQERDQRCCEADQIQETMQQVHEYLRVEIRRRQAIQEEGANRKRVPAPNILVGSRVWLDARNIRTTRPTRKLQYKRLGPFRVKRQVSPYAYELELPTSIRIHRVQPVSLMDPVSEDLLQGQVMPPPPPVEVDGEEEYQVSSVEDSRMYRNRLQYLIRWTGYDSLTSEPAKFVDGLQAVGEFHRRYPQKTGPLEKDLGGPRA